MDDEASLVERVIDASSIQPVIAITEVGQLNSTNMLDCGMAIEDTFNRPILKIFNPYGGTVEEEDSTRKDRAKKYLLLRHKKTKKVTIYGAKVRYFKKPDYFKMKTYEDEALQQNQEFNEVFGTKKLTRISKSKANDDAIDVSTDIFTNISTTDTLTSSGSQISECLLYLPLGCNRFSNKIDDVYPVSTILTDNEINLMTDYAKQILSMLPIPYDCEDLTTFFIANMNIMPHKTFQNICLLTYADGLIRLLKTRPSEINYKNRIIYANSDLINDKIFDHFLEYTRIDMEFTSKMKDKSICFILIIMLLINRNIIDLSMISPHLPMSSQKRLILLLRLIGASPVEDDKTKYTLKIPLAALPANNKQPKRKKQRR